MTEKLLGLLLLTDLYPLWRARKANAGTSLAHAVRWGIVAWLGWLSTVGITLLADEKAEQISAYISLCLTGCAGVAVLGARRPGMSAWSFVVLGLLTVQMLPIAIGLEWLRTSPLLIVFLSATLAVSVGNYLPTRLGAAALLVGLAGACELLLIAGPTAWAADLTVPARCGRGLLALAPWLGHAMVRVRSRSDFDLLWCDFRDRYGFVWAQRLQDQFNRAAANAGWPVRLGWRGLRGVLDDTCRTNSLETLQSLLRRFGGTS